MVVRTLASGTVCGPDAEISAGRVSRSGVGAHLTRGMTNLRAIGVCVGAAIPLLAGCRDHKSPPRPPSTTVAVPASTSTTADRAAPVLAGYRAFWDGYLRAADPMDPTNPVLAAHATGDELRQVQTTFASHFQMDEVIRGALDLRPLVTAQTDSTATINDCYGDSTHIFDRTTGSQKDPPESVRYQVTATLVVEGGTWKVSAMKKTGEACIPA